VAKGKKFPPLLSLSLLGINWGEIRRPEGKRPFGRIILKWI
jgi:hypothetical protein